MQFISLPHAHNSQTGTCIWGQSEVQGRKVYHWAGSHGQREPVGVTLTQTNPFFIPLTHHINTAAFSISYFSSSVCQYLLSFISCSCAPQGAPCFSKLHTHTSSVPSSFMFSILSCFVLHPPAALATVSALYVGLRTLCSDIHVHSINSIHVYSGLTWDHSLLLKFWIQWWQCNFEGVMVYKTAEQEVMWATQKNNKPTTCRCTGD